MTSTQTQTETLVLQTRGSSNEAVEAGESEPGILQEPEPSQQGKWILPKILSAGVSFFVAGVNDGSLGSLIPYVIRSYGIGTSMVAVLYVHNPTQTNLSSDIHFYYRYGVTFCGWLFAALSNSFICQYLDLGAMLALGATFQS